ncbi:hypothetical protein [Azospirillum soli]|uniref:hypothetical protein n=1 Tax=Azospirillum soli TaxID=1304799 RepID=UPI001AE6282E|nr:hypothetical protein [Azospirillum soli]MBP2315441.1 hypothetical protein [Azospirillum soli]
MTYRLSDGTRTKTIDLGSPVNAGGATGKVFRIAQNTSLCAKIYHDTAYAKKIRPKIVSMLEARPSLEPIRYEGRKYQQIAWPDSIVENDAGEFVGFTMPYLTASKTVALSRLLTKSGRQQEKISESYETRLLVARNIAAIVAAVHGAGHAIVDLKPINFRLHRGTPFICLIDADGFRIAGHGQAVYPAEHVSDEYTAPESKEKPSSDLGVPQDLFAMATLIFQLINNGVHPFQGVPEDGNVPTSTQERIYAGLYAYGRLATRLKPSPQSAHTLLDDDTRALFEQAFTSIDRPTAADWLAHLTEITRPPRIRKCGASPEHLAFTRGCPACHLQGIVEASKRVAAARSAASATPAHQTPSPPLSTTAQSAPQSTNANQKFGWTWPRVIAVVFACWVGWQWLVGGKPANRPAVTVPQPKQEHPVPAAPHNLPTLGLTPDIPVDRPSPKHECRDPKTGLVYTVFGETPKCFPGDVPEAKYKAGRSQREAILTPITRMYETRPITIPPKNTTQYAPVGEWSQKTVGQSSLFCVATAGFGNGLTLNIAFFSSNEAVLAVGLPDGTGAPLSRDAVLSKIVTVDIDGDKTYGGRVRDVEDLGLSFGKIGEGAIAAIKDGLSMFVVVDGVEPGVRLTLRGSRKALTQAQDCARAL